MKSIHTLSGHDGFEIKSLTPISRSYYFTELFGLDQKQAHCFYFNVPATLSVEPLFFTEFFGLDLFAHYYTSSL